MSQVAIWHWLDRFLQPRASPIDAYLLSPAEMQRTLERERLRSDRTGEVFSVIMFSAVRDHLQHATARELSRVSQQRLRDLDVAGHLADGRLCVLLPLTPPAGAGQVASDLLSSWKADLPLPAHAIFAYPLQAQKWYGNAVRTAAEASEISGAETLILPPMPLWKRTLDVLGCSLGLILLSPLLAFVALAIKLTSPGPVLFTQLRHGRAGKPFWIYKFRTMVADAEALKVQLLDRNERDGPAFKMDNDPRVTALGRLLRATNVDELPQLWNVLKGEMSLVGPRPLPCGESQDCETWQRRRLDVTPGLTCIWQATSHRAKIPFAEWVRMDLQYIGKRSWGLDLKLIVQTLRSMFTQKPC